MVEGLDGGGWSAIDADRIAQLLHVFLRDFLDPGQVVQALVRPSRRPVPGDDVADVLAQEGIDVPGDVEPCGLVEVEFGGRGGLGLLIVRIGHGRSRCGRNEEPAEKDDCGARERFHGVLLVTA